MTILVGLGVDMGLHGISAVMKSFVYICSTLVMETRRPHQGHYTGTTLRIPQNIEVKLVQAQR